MFRGDLSRSGGLTGSPSVGFGSNSSVALSSASSGLVSGRSGLDFDVSRSSPLVMPVPKKYKVNGYVARHRPCRDAMPARDH